MSDKLVEEAVWRGLKIGPSALVECYPHQRLAEIFVKLASALEQQVARCKELEAELALRPWRAEHDDTM